MTLPKLIITGSVGRIGSILWRGLGDAFELYGLDQHADRRDRRAFRADIANSKQVEAAFRRIPALTYVVHLAGDHLVGDWPSILKNNIVGTKNIYEAARLHGVKRVVFASSNHVTGAYEGFPPRLHTQPDPQQITSLDPIRPDSFYGVSKATGEALARMYHELYGLESVCLRIGTVLDHDDPTRDPRHRSTWLSHRDLVQLVKKSLLGNITFAIYYGISNNKHRFWDISNAAAEIGYQPEDDASQR